VYAIAPQCGRIDRNFLRILARRRVLSEIYPLPEGTLPPEWHDEVEDPLLPGYGERMMANCSATITFADRQE
jgi:hypothetical protein